MTLTTEIMDFITTRRIMVEVLTSVSIESEGIKQGQVSRFLLGRVLTRSQLD